MNNQYVILTGSKNNAGDFLIKYRAKKLFEKIRPDREIIDFNAWEPIDDNKLKIINNSKCLILMGGPSLQKGMYPNIYKLPSNLDKIEVPITTMGIGWKSQKGNWSDTYDYPLTDDSLKLLERIKSDGLTASVRDFHTLNVLGFKGYENFLMTGCPAYYELNSTGKDFVFSKNIQKVAFSLGVSFIDSPSMERNIKNQILSLKNRFKNISFDVVFHHSLDKDKFMQAHGSTLKHNQRHNDFANWLVKQNVNIVDISGSAENLINYYSNIDLHVGYRVHAHIFMNSIKKLSLLISEDGRAKGSQSAINGMVVDGYHAIKSNLLLRILNKIGIKYDRYQANQYANEDIDKMLNYEMKTNGYRAKQSSLLLNENYKIMEGFIKSLP